MIVFKETVLKLLNVYGLFKNIEMTKNKESFLLFYILASKIY